MIDPTILQARHSAKVIEEHGGKTTIYEKEDQFLRGNIFVNIRPKELRDSLVFFDSGVGIPTIQISVTNLSLERAEKVKKDLELAISIVKQCSQTRESQLRLPENRKKGAESQIKVENHPFHDYHQKTYDAAVEKIKKINDYWDALEEIQ